MPSMWAIAPCVSTPIRARPTASLVGNISRIIGDPIHRLDHVESRDISVFSSNCPPCVNLWYESRPGKTGPLIILRTTVKCPTCRPPLDQSPSGSEELKPCVAPLT